MLTGVTVEHSEQIAIDMRTLVAYQSLFQPEFIHNSASVLNFSKRAFCHASPTVWNSLPQTAISDLTVTTGTFKNRLKSALYGRAFLQ